MTNLEEKALIERQVECAAKREAQRKKGEERKKERKKEEKEKRVVASSNGKTWTRTRGEHDTVRTINDTHNFCPSASRRRATQRTRMITRRPLGNTQRFVVDRSIIRWKSLLWINWVGARIGQQPRGEVRRGVLSPSRGPFCAHEIPTAVCLSLSFSLSLFIWYPVNCQFINPTTDDTAVWKASPEVWPVLANVKIIVIIAIQSGIRGSVHGSRSSNFHESLVR